jgi:ribosomal protein L11 methyltransferase
LAILAEKLGAGHITAIDNDAWSIDNAGENFNSNNCDKILLISSEIIPVEGMYNVILANINRNIILQNMGPIKQHLAKDGVVLLSGLLSGDEPVIMDEARKQGLKLTQRFEMSGWICLQLESDK